MKAQAAALLTGAHRLTALLDRYSDATVTQAIAEIRTRAATQMRAMIATIPPGRWTAKAFIDSDGVVNEPLTIALDRHPRRPRPRPSISKARQSLAPAR